MCNINPQEVANRRNIGHAGLIGVIIISAILFVIDVNQWLRVIVFIPAFLAATGYLQARNKFCIGYAGASQHHADQGDAVEITDRSALASDKKKDRKINIKALVIALTVTIVITFLPL